MVTTTTADKALKSFYLDAVTNALDYKASPFLAKIKKTTSDVWGKDVRKVVRYGFSSGVGAGTETGDLPSANGNKYTQFVSTLKNLYGTIEISDKAVRASANNQGAFVNLLEDEMAGLINSATFNFSRMLYGDGSGLLGVADASVAVGFTTVTMLSVKNFEEGMLVDFVNNGYLVPDAIGRRISKVDREAKTITVEGAKFEALVSTNLYVYLHDCQDKEITGLSALFADTGSLYGVDIETNTWMKPYKLESTKISSDIVEKAMDEIEENSGSKVNMIITSAGVRRALKKACRDAGIQEQYVVDEDGKQTFSVAGVPVYADRFCPVGTMFLLNTNDFALHQLCDWQWLEGEDGKILKQVAGKPVYTATLVKYAELMCCKPQGQGRIQRISEV